MNSAPYRHRSPSVTSHILVTIPLPSTGCPHVVAFARYPSAPRAHGCRGGLRLLRAGSSAQSAESHLSPTDWLTTAGCSPPRLTTTQLPLVYRPESVCLERTRTSLDVCAWRRTRRRLRRAHEDHENNSAGTLGMTCDEWPAAQATRARNESWTRASHTRTARVHDSFRARAAKRFVARSRVIASCPSRVVLRSARRRGELSLPS